GHSELQRRERALIAIEAFAEAARRSDRHGSVEIFEVDAVGVDQFSRVADRTSDAHRHQRVARSITSALAYRSRNAEVGGAVRHCRELGPDAARGEESGVDVPARARSREACETDSGSAEALRDVSRDVDAYEVERYARRFRLAQRREAMANLL